MYGEVFEGVGVGRRCAGGGGLTRITKGASLFEQLGSRAGGHKVPQ